VKGYRDLGMGDGGGARYSGLTSVNTEDMWNGGPLQWGSPPGGTVLSK
jgi:hypothetical protein